MPGVIMENGRSHGAHTNHDRDPLLNGANGAVQPAERALDKGKGRQEPLQSPLHAAVTNGGSNGAVVAGPSQSQVAPENQTSNDLVNRMQDMPEEIQHITVGFESLSTLLTRLAQVTHNRLSNKILELAAMPTPASAMNGNGALHGNSLDDNSGDNVRKKVELLKFAERTHADWTKALVITQWSRISTDVSRLIDLKVHLDKQKQFYDEAWFALSEVKRSLVHARVPNPDLKTAVEILSTGKVSWMPDLGYIDPPPLSAKELLKSLQNLNTLLSIRLNLHEYDRIPVQFKKYTIKSGRVTFQVQGEFEVDLTIADEKPETQFWFIDFRFLFSPSLSQLSENLLYMIESRVNAALEKDGLAGCYKFLHELVLTHKISELRRQAVELSRGIWIEKLRVEPLRRALSIQYWVDRYNKDGKDGPKSWIILGVNSGKRPDATADPKLTSQISIRWFRDGKEVKDFDLPLELTELSTEKLLQSVISRHIDHILSSTYRTLATKPLFSNKELSLSYRSSASQAEEPELKVQLTRQQSINVTIEPVTGEFAISPASKLSQQAQFNLNRSKDPATHAHEFIQNLRCIAISDEITSRAMSVGWQPTKNPGLKQEDLKPIVPRDTLHLSWFKRAGWDPSWIVALSSSMSGERWWLLEMKPLDSKTLEITEHLQIPLKTTSPESTHSFLSNLHLYAAGIVSNHANLRALHSQHFKYMLRSEALIPRASTLGLPTIVALTKDFLLSKNKSPRTRKPWAKDFIKISFQGLEYQPVPRTAQILPSTTPQLPGLAPVETQIPSGSTPELKNASGDIENAVVVAEALLIKPLPPGLDLAKQRVDKDIAFHPATGSFAFRLHTKVGESSISALTERLRRVEQLVDFVEVVKRHETSLNCEKISLGQLVFSYGSKLSSTGVVPIDAMAIDEESDIYRATIQFGDANALMSIELQLNNPHIRIIDHLDRILNTQELGLNSVARMLPTTLYVMKAFMAIELSWTPLTEAGQGEVLILDRAAEWHIVRYTLPPTTTEQNERKFTLGIKLDHRGNSAWWCVRRNVEQRSSGSQNTTAGDEFDTVLKTVWDSNEPGQKWRGMSTSAIAQPEDAMEMLVTVDAAVRRYAANGPAEFVHPNNAQSVNPAPQPQPQLQLQPQPQTQPQQPVRVQNLNQHQLQQQRQQLQRQQQMMGRNMKQPEVIDLD